MPIDAQATTLTLGGVDVLLTKYVDSWAEEIYAEHLLRFWTADLPEGVHPMMASGLRSFGAGECFIKGKELDQVSMQIEFAYAFCGHR